MAYQVIILGVDNKNYQLQVCRESGSSSSQHGDAGYRSHNSRYWERGYRARLVHVQQNLL